MNEVIGEVLPLALGVTVSPIPVVAAILMLLSPRATATSVGFLVGWITGIVVTVTVFALLSTALPDSDPDSSQPVKATIQVVLGALLLVVAAHQWRARPQPGQPREAPHWMSAIGSMTTAKATGLGVLLAAVNPKNLIMGAGAGVVIGSADLDGGQTTVAIVVFTLVAAASVAVPVVAHLIAPRKLTAPLESLRVWLLAENALIMSVLLLVLGVSVIGKGVAGF